MRRAFRPAVDARLQRPVRRRRRVAALDGPPHAPKSIPRWNAFSGAGDRIGAAESNPFDRPLRQAQDGIERLRAFLRDPGNGAPRMAVKSRWQGLIRGFRSYGYHEPREHHPISEQPIDADNHAIKALCYWLYDRFGAVRPRGLGQSIPLRTTW